MKNKQPNQPSFDDIIFAGRNQAYGAYQLRVTYPHRLARALSATLASASIVMCLLFVKGSSSPDEKPVIIREGPTVAILKEAKPPKEVKKSPPAAKQVQERVAAVKYTQYKIQEDELVKNDPVTQDEISEALVDTESAEGEKKVIPVFQHPAKDSGNHDNPISSTEEPLQHVQVEATYAENWEKFLRKYLDPMVAVDNGAPTGSYTIVIQFVVDTLGAVSDIRPLTSLGHGMEEEAIRVIKKAMRWKPARQNGKAVKAYRRQPITFQVLDDLP